MTGLYTPAKGSMNIYIYIYIYMYLFVCIYIERERDMYIRTGPPPRRTGGVSRFRLPLMRDFPL